MNIFGLRTIKSGSDRSFYFLKNKFRYVKTVYEHLQRWITLQSTCLTSVRTRVWSMKPPKHRASMAVT